MTRTLMIVTLIATLVLSFGSPVLSITPAWAQATTTENELLALRQQVASLEVQVQRLASRDYGSTTGDLEAQATPECIKLSDALMVTQAARGLCR